MSPRLLAIATLSVAAVLAALLLGGDRQSAVGAGGVERATPAASEPAERPDDGPTADVPSELVPSRREAEADSTTPPDEPSSTPAAASAEAPPPVIPEGTALTGTLVDAEGSPVAEAVLELSANGRRRDVRVTPDDLGRFAVAVDRHGELGVAAIADGIGRSADLTRTVPEGVTTDLGVLRLLGDGRLAGRVVFPGGEPFPGVSLSARAVDKAASPGLRRANMRTDDEGRFSLTALAPGPFRLTAFGEDPLPVNGNDTFQSGDEDVELVVDATLIRARCVDAAGSTVPMKGIEIATISLASSTEHDVTGMTSFGFKRERDGHSFMIAPGLPYRLQATDAEYRSYFAVLTGDLRAGIHDVDLMEDAPGLGSLRVVLPPSGAGEGAQLTIGDLQRDGEDVMGG
ncbi:MAG: carboxypeptidase-like regulatory domain-containing protein, partial [Planctomycetota bacterium]